MSNVIDLNKYKSVKLAQKTGEDRERKAVDRTAVTVAENVKPTKGLRR